MAIGFVDFNVGQTLTAAHVDGIVRQTMMRFADNSAMGSALAGVEEEGMHTYTEDLKVLWVYEDGEYRDQIGPDLTYVPVWTNLTVSGSAVVATRQLFFSGNKMRCRGQVTLGGGNTPSGAVSMTIPGSRTADAFGSSGAFIMSDAGVIFTGVLHVAPGGSVINFLTPTGQVNTTVPFTWANGDVLQWDITIGLAAA